MRHFFCLLLMACGFGSFAAPPDGLLHKQTIAATIFSLDHIAAMPDLDQGFGTSFHAASPIMVRTKKSFDVAVPPDEGLTTTNCNFSDNGNYTTATTHHLSGNSANFNLLSASNLVFNESDYGPPDCSASQSVLLMTATNFISTSDALPDIGSSGCGFMYSMTAPANSLAWKDLPFTIGWKSITASNDTGTQIRSHA